VPDEPLEFRFEMPELRVPQPPRDVPYAELEDHQARALLEANGIGTDHAALVAALEHPVEVIRAAAARTLGATGDAGALDALRALAGRNDDTASAEAAFALARLGERDEGERALRALLDLPVDAYVAPLLAAGSLARLGDAAGVAAIERGLGSRNELVRRTAAKQLFHFVGVPGADAWALFERALADDDRGVVAQARAELRELDAPEARALEAR